MLFITHAGATVEKIVLLPDIFISFDFKTFNDNKFFNNKTARKY